MKEINNKNKKDNNKKYWYFPFFSTRFPTQKVKASVGNIWWSLSVIALGTLWCVHAVVVKNWLFLILGIAGGIAAEFFLIRDFVRTRRKEKEENLEKEHSGNEKETEK